MFPLSGTCSAQGPKGPVVPPRSFSAMSNAESIEDIEDVKEQRVLAARRLRTRWPHTDGGTKTKEIIFK